MRAIKFKMIGSVYVADGEYTSYSKRYGKFLTIPDEFPSNGADVVKDLCPTGFFNHDFCCHHGKFDDGSRMYNLQASFIYYDILIAFKINRVIALGRLIMTFLFGGGQARKNGMFKLNNEKNN